MRSVTALMTAFVAVLMVVFNLRRQREYDEARNRAQLEEMRAMLEMRIYELNDRLLATETRWNDVNHLLVSSQQATVEPDVQPHKVPLTNFLKAMGITQDDLEIEDNLAFVLTPFHSHYDEAYSSIVSACRQAGFRCLRGDEEYVEGDLLAHVLRLLVRARVVVANVSGRNPNVFYELGIANALDKSTILVSEGIEDVPFDIRSRRIILYEKSDDLQEMLSGALLAVTRG